jgi:hypothetical protein
MIFLPEKFMRMKKSLTKKISGGGLKNCVDVGVRKGEYE